MAKSVPVHFEMNDYVVNRLKLRPLVIFDMVLKTHSVIQAAGLLNLSQPTVTKAIKELESQLNLLLFDRTSRGMQPTQAGLLLGSRVKILLAEMRYLADDINSFQQAGRGHVVVGTLLSGSAHLLPETIIQLKKQSPNIVLTVIEGTTQALYSSLQQGELDLVIGRLPSKMSGFYQVSNFQHVTLYKEQLSLVVNPQHELLALGLLELPSLIDYPWILPLRTTLMRSLITGYFNDYGLAEPENLIESVSILTNVNILLNSNAICCVSSLVAKQLEQYGLVKILPLGDIGEPIDVGYSYRKKGNLTPACQKFIHYLHQHMLSNP